MAREEKDENQVDSCLHSIAFSFESGRLWCSILFIKMAVSMRPEEKDDSGTDSAFLKTNYLMN